MQFRFFFRRSLHCGRRGAKPALVPDALKEKRELLGSLKRKLKNVQEKGVELNHEENAELKIQKSKAVSEETTCLEAMGHDLTVERQRYEWFVVQF